MLSCRVIVCCVYLALCIQSESNMEFLGSLKVSQLKEQLAARNKETKGGKVILISRLHAVLVDEGTDPEVFVRQLESDSVRPGDSASQVSGRQLESDSVRPGDSASQVVGRQLDSIQPGDSASQVQSLGGGSNNSSVASSVKLRRLEEASTQASIAAKLKRLKEKQEIDRQLADLQRQKELLELEEALDASKARETVLLSFSKADEHTLADGTHESKPVSLIIPDPERNTSHPEPHEPVLKEPCDPVLKKHHESVLTEHHEPVLKERHEPALKDKECHELVQKGSPIPQLCPNSPADMKREHVACTQTHLKDEREQTAALMRLPVVELKKFGGDVTEFAHFMRSFDLKIGQKISDEAEKLYFLEQHMVPGSKAHHIVEGCLYLKDGYKEARRLLFKRYGQPNTLASAYLDKILQQKPIKGDDSDGLDRYSILLTSCRNALQESTNLMDDPRTLRSVTANLPQPLIHRWRQKVDDIEEGEGRCPTFEDVVKFVSREARVSSNAVFGQQLYNRDQRRTAEQAKPHSALKQKSFVATTKAELPRSKCSFCDREGHQTSECRRLADVSQEEKKAFVQRMSLCYGCLKRGHRSHDCKRRATCRTCGRRHPSALHWTRPDTEEGQQVKQQVQGQGGGHINAASVTSCQTSGDDSFDGKPGKAVLPVVPVVIRGPSRQVQTYAFLDSGSTHSFVSESVLQELNMDRAPRRNLHLTTVERDGGLETQVVDGTWITDLQRKNALQLPPLFTLKKIPVSKEECVRQEDIRRWEHLRDVELQSAESEEVGLLLGANAFLAMEPLEVLPSVNGSPYAVRTRFGWVISGLKSTSKKDSATVCRTVARQEAASIEEMVRQMYNQEYEEKLHWDTRGLSVEDKLWTSKVESSVRKQEDDHYEVGLPLMERKLPRNQAIAERRLEGLKVKFSKDADFSESYKNYMSDMRDKGFAELVPQDELERNDGRVWYLPHHAVLHARKPGKVRVVFDCAASYKGVCLNDLLLQGPDQTNSLLDVLMRFRLEKIAFIADIEGMFNQVRVPKSDRDVFRYLWWKDGNPKNEVEHLRMSVHLFGARSSPSIACYALRRTAADNEAEFSSAAVDTIQKNFYVDDVLKSVPTEEGAVCLAHELKDLCQRGGFNLTKFSSNSPVVVSSFPAHDRSKEMKQWTGSGKCLPDERALGVVWETSSDTLRIAVEMRNISSKPLTRRGMMSAVCGLYDPLGMVSPTLLRGRLILQELCRLQVEWDSEIPSARQREWMEWLMSIEKIDELGVGRCIKPPDFGEVTSYQIHHFADASEVAYGTVSYVRMTNSSGDVHCSFVMGKAHLAPLKTVTVPRLELMAAVTAVKVDSLVSGAFEFEPTHHFWTDSTTVLRYIRNRTTRYHTFVANRLSVIHDGSTPEQWRHVDSDSNPADDVSRGVQSTRWLTGPSFLWEQEEQWPATPTALLEVDERDPEVKVKMTALVTGAEETTESPLRRLIEYYSTWRRLIKAVAWIRRAVRMLKDKVRGCDSPTSGLSIADLEAAEKLVVSYTQRASFPQETKDLEAGREVRVTSVLARLDPFLEDGVLRVRGRLTNSDLSRDSKYPIILPSKGHVVDLIVADMHQRNGHEGRQHVMCSLRRKYWVLKANSVVRRCLHRCVSCRRRLRRASHQKMADLPSDRVEAVEQAFAKSGVDYFGPFYVKQGRSLVKRYGVIFTCLSMRAVHIEVAEDLSSDSFLCALRRFVARRGCVRLLRSDKGTNFVGANRELREELEKMAASEDVLHKTMLNMGVEWKFNTAAASHHGGAWERQIRSIRKILEALIGSQSLRDETLRTFLCEVESILNSRPLTPVSPDPRDPQPLTPNHLLILTANNVLMPFGLTSDTDSTSRKRWKQARYLADAFWRRWRHEYVPLLQERPHVMTRRQTNLAVGDVVLLVDNGIPRGQWPLGRVVDVKPGADGLVRSVEVRTRGIVLQRPVTKLVKLYSNAT